MAEAQAASNAVVRQVAEWIVRKLRGTSVFEHRKAALDHAPPSQEKQEKVAVRKRYIFAHR
jgi:hypothetical protein